MDKGMKQIVISAVNLRKGGTLTILRQCLAFLSEWAPVHGYQVTALVHKRELADYPYIRTPLGDRWMGQAPLVRIYDYGSYLTRIRRD